MSNTSFPFRYMSRPSVRSSESHAISCSSLMSHHRVKNKSKIVKEQHWRWLIYALRNFLLRNNMLRVFRSKHPCSWKFNEFHMEAPVLECLFFLKMMKLYKDIYSAWISRTSADICLWYADIPSVLKIQ